MSVYVDRLRDWDWKYGKSCHMYADTNEELHKMAARLGLKREWFQKSTSGPHYDLTESKRALAVRLGVIEVDTETMVDWSRKWRAEAVAAVKAALLISEEEANKVRAYLYR
jgi:hypothetical protein